MEPFWKEFITGVADTVWGTPLLVLLLGGGVYFAVFSKLIPFWYLRHAILITMGKYDSKNDPGDITHFQALCSALASTVGVSNISGVAIAIVTGGPGAVFWMWVCAIVGMATKFFTCTLSILYRGKDDAGHIQGGVPYFIMEGLGPKFRPLAIFFCIAGLFGCLVLFQANQLTQIIRDQIYAPQGWFTGSETQTQLGNALVGFVSLVFVSCVIFGGIKRIGVVASKMVPMMVVLYLLMGFVIVLKNFSSIPEMLSLILNDAFTGNAVAGGAVGTVIQTGVRRAAFSNEAGIGTETLAHGAAKTKEPVREGLVAMMGPFIDTIVVCSITAFAILSTGVWKTTESSGITVTSQAFEQALPGIGPNLLLLCAIVFSLSTMIGYSYYGTKCSGFLFGSKSKKYYNVFYAVTIILGAMVSLDTVMNFLDSMYALMAIPTMVATLLLSPKVMKAAREYFARLKAESNS
ncbi:MAG TPA: alanine:cation symporter family protein [Verrucomicrobiales bacterium]|nr:alanine:cation symporter family protein [Verrucomicrobiales bacterium]HIL68517.1 alanine:cation symporter family protein [Verrucomicrobiota bacterium]